MHSSKLRIFQNRLEKVNSAQLGKFCRNALNSVEPVSGEFGGVVVVHSSLQLVSSTLIGRR